MSLGLTRLYCNFCRRAAFWRSARAWAFRHYLTAPGENFPPGAVRVWGGFQDVGSEGQAPSSDLPALCSAKLRLLPKMNEPIPPAQPGPQG